MDRKGIVCWNGESVVQYTVKPRFTNLIRSWRSFVNRNYEGWNFNSGNYLFTTDTK